MEYRYDISCIVVSYNCLDSLRACLESLQRHQDVASEIIVVDNCSYDGTQSFLKTCGVKTVLSPENLGYGRAVNLAARQAEGRHLFILNPDTVVPEGALRDLLSFASINPGIGLVSPALIYQDGRPQLSARRFPRRRDLLFSRGSPFFKIGLAKERDSGYLNLDVEGPIEVPAVSATALFVRLDLFREIGGFDERFFLYLEDLDLCKRISDQGLRIWLLPDVKIMHLWRQSSSARPCFASYQHHVSVHRYFRKHYPKEWLPNLALGIALVVGFVVNSILIMFHRRG